MENKHAGFWVRFLAYIIDSLIVGFVMGILLTIMGVTVTTVNAHGMTQVTDIANAYITVVGWLYWSITQSSSWQATIGKKVMGLKLVNEDGTRVSFLKALGRSTVGYLISAIVLCIGFISIGVTEKKVGFHDMIFKTYVVYE